VQPVLLSKRFGILLFALCLPHAGIGKVGESLEECIARYGEEQPLDRSDTALFKTSKLHAFSSNGFRVVVEILGGKAVATTFCRETSLLAKNRPQMPKTMIDKLLNDNSDGEGWKRAVTPLTIMQWVRGDKAVAATYAPDHHLTFYSTKVDESTPEETTSTIAAESTVEPNNATMATAEASIVTLPDTLTLGTQTYKNPTYRGHNAYLLTFTHETGVATARISNLAPAIQEQLGFDRAAAEAAESSYFEQQQEALKLAEAQARATEAKKQAVSTAQTANEVSASLPAPAQTGQGSLDLSHRSLNGGPALRPDAIAANLFDLKGQIVRVVFITSDHRAVRQTTDGFYELNVLPDESNAVVRIPVDIGRKWFAPRNNKRYPRTFIVRVDAGELENVYGTVREGAILVAIGTRVQRGTGNQAPWVEW